MTLTDVQFHISASQLPDSLNQLHVQFKSESSSFKYFLPVKNGVADSVVSVSESGNFNIEFPNLSIESKQMRVVPGWLSIVPPLLAILLALIIRQVVVALAAGIYIGAIFIYDYNPLAALLRVSDKFMLESLTDPDHTFIILFTLLIGGVVGIISKNGGTVGLAKQITRLARNSRSGMISSWLMGIMIFFDDYANSLIIGNMMRPITDRLRISREKLAYIVDSTAAPVASIFVISTWIGYEVGLIEDGLRSIGSNLNAYDVFIQSIPYGFYPIAAIFMVFTVSFLSKDFGPMYKAEKRSRETGDITSEKMESNTKDLDDSDIYKGEKAHWLNGAIPILIILFGTILGLYFTGTESLTAAGITEYNIQDIINHSDSYSSLLWASFVACIVAIVMSVAQGILSLEESIGAWTKGIQSMLVAVIILVFAWAISAVTVELKTADYIISIISETIDPKFLPILVFIVCALTSFSTGTSWGTMAIVTPIVVPLAHKMIIISGYSLQDEAFIIYGVVSAVLAGSVFGDHCSPIADTTILSSLASKCNHIDHVQTQLPYAVITGIVCMALGYIPVAFGLSPFISIIIICSVLFGIVFFFGKDVTKYSPTQ